LEVIVSDERQVWKFSVIVEATDCKANEIGEAIVRLLCPDDDHDGPCDVPWTLLRSGFEHMDEVERVAWSDGFAGERQRPDEHTVVLSDGTTP
jgi:hypothetical protein